MYDTDVFDLQLDRRMGVGDGVWTVNGGTFMPGTKRPPELPISSNDDITSHTDSFTMSNELKPLGGVLDSVIGRLAAIEAQLGITPSTSTAPSTHVAPAPAAVIEEELHPRLSAYDEHVERALVPLTEAFTALGPEMRTIGTDIASVWSGMRGLVELGTKYKRPKGDVPTALSPHLKPCQDAISKVTSARLDRKFDFHIKAVKEMLSCVSWVVISPPPSTANFVKDTVGASDFWANKIRKGIQNQRKRRAETCQILRCSQGVGE